MSNIKRSMVFIDAGNLFSGWWGHCKSKGHVKQNKVTGREYFTKRVSYGRLLNRISEDTDLIRGYYYDATPQPVGKSKQSFYDMLRQNEITIVTKPLKYKRIICKHCNTKDENVPYQKGVDVALATDMMGLAFEDAYDLAILISGDNDFENAVNYLKGKGKKVWVVSFIDSLGQDLMRVADRVIKLDSVFDDVAE
jgi:uncharacterized LabA/DUF88 family protein